MRDERGGVGEVVQIRGHVDERQALRRVQRLACRCALLQAEELEAGNARERGKMLERHAAAGIDGAGLQIMLAGIAGPYEACPDCSDVWRQALGPMRGFRGVGGEVGNLGRDRVQRGREHAGQAHERDRVIEFVAALLRDLDAGDRAEQGLQRRWREHRHARGHARQARDVADEL